MCSQGVKDLHQVRRVQLPFRLHLDGASSVQFQLNSSTTTVTTLSQLQLSLLLHTTSPFVEHKQKTTTTARMTHCIASFINSSVSRILERNRTSLLSFLSRIKRPSILLNPRTPTRIPSALSVCRGRVPTSCYPTTRKRFFVISSDTKRSSLTRIMLFGIMRQS